MLPKAILFDLDDTLISAYGNPERAWRKVVHEYEARLGNLSPNELAQHITAEAREFWSDAQRHKVWRHDLPESRRRIVGQVFERLSLGSPQLSCDLANRYTELRDEEMFLFPGVLETLTALADQNVRLALITNGSAGVQRTKIARFGLGPIFEHVQIEGEHGFGKPEERAYLHAMSGLNVMPEETWIVGDNLVWEVEAPQRLGIFSIWYDGEGKGLPSSTTIQPDRIVRALPELIG
ncbi:MAG: HAD family hydrolase [Micropepsaceae bacterium]